MANPVSIRVEGLRELSLKMRNLSEKTHRQFSTSATGAAAQVVKKKYKSNLKSNPSTDSGELEKHVISKKVPRSEADGLASAHYVTVKKFTYTDKNKKRKRDTRKSAGFIEFGTVNMPPEPGLRNALVERLQQAIEAMKDRLAKRIAAAAK